MNNPFGTGLQAFLRAANIYGPQDDSAAYENMPSELPVANKPELVNRTAPYASKPGQYDELYPKAPTGGYAPPGMPGTSNYASGKMSGMEELLEAFKNNVLNPPKREHMTYPKNTLAGLDAALKIAAEPSPLEKNRVYINDHPYQKQNVYTDPVTGEKKFMTTVKDPSFMTQVMKAMPASVSAATDILNQPHMDAVTDWDLKNKGLASAVEAESKLGLARQRNATADIGIPSQATARLTTANASMMNAETRAKLAALKDMPDSERLQFLQDGKVTIEELKIAGMLKRYEMGQANEIEVQTLRNAGLIENTRERGAQDRLTAGVRGEQDRLTEGTRQSGRVALEEAKITGRIRVQELEYMNKEELEELMQDNRIELQGVRGDEERKNIIARAIQARITQAAPRSAAPPRAPTPAQMSQAQKLEAQRRAVTYVSKNTEHGEYLQYVEGAPVIKPNTPQEIADVMYAAIYPSPKPDTNLPAPNVKPPEQMPPPSVPGAFPQGGGVTPPVAPTGPAGAPPQTGTIRVVSPDGQTGTWDLSKGPLPPGFKRIE